MASFIVLGILIQMLLEFFSRGAEHGHVHGEKPEGKFPALLLASLSVHALLEGIPLAHSTPFLWGIIIHKIPVAVILGGFLIRTGIAIPKQWFFISVFAIMTPVGALLGEISALEGIYPYFQALVVGVVLHVASVILFETSSEHRLNWRKLAAIVLGFILACLI